MNKFFKIVALVLIIALITAPAAIAVSMFGSRGDEVTAIQRKLSERGYYSAGIDGIFGTATKNAVVNFQKDNALTPDGIAGPNTLSALGIDSANSYNSADYQLLARLISAEARGESYMGQVAVGAVVLNRISHPSFPDTLAGVIYQKGAFSCIADGQFDEPVSDSAYSAARDALNGMDPSGGAIYYFNPNTATNSWIWSRPHIVTIGNHRFCA
ncbi:MAG: spore cortex-lytic enzyme [Clostridia bacterium]|nr:spore cortex-lytic enzyme [Clostridia bacterium]